MRPQLTAIEQQKKLIRQQTRQLRTQIDQQSAAIAARNLCINIQALTSYQSAKAIACFLSFDGEINTAPTIDALLEDKGRCFLPKLKPSKPNRLWFMPYDGQTRLSVNRFGIPEVDKPVNLAIRVSSLDILLMPLVAFDTKGNRLGMGGGFYDATLAHLLSPEFADKRPLCIGIAYDEQRVSAIPAQEWDYPLDGVVTPTKFYQF
ncbi:5-formyltetrahydrofolate cyclo-ligase [Aliikangiella coralliicola]|uniref:5-formyltetrahydrofolate cyclo-ligase n=1 Tax=Aliikangiella coralliicola TaxID=2592383 RepID=A0A545UIA1_9GAMM|nr:5-formyltetrahydrofolate cyclo-ligase [Aliikangiella coralliicola]TQV89189.1 5-formyltetrahydrofolate cyclo-ligase [Aliikangiella coralliicola]